MIEENATEQIKQAKIAIGRAMVKLIQSEHISSKVDHDTVKAEALQEFATAIHLLDSVIEGFNNGKRTDINQTE